MVGKKKTKQKSRQSKKHSENLSEADGELYFSVGYV